MIPDARPRQTPVLGLTVPEHRLRPLGPRLRCSYCDAPVARETPSFTIRDAVLHVVALGPVRGVALWDEGPHSPIFALCDDCIPDLIVVRSTHPRDVRSTHPRDVRSTHPRDVRE